MKIKIDDAQFLKDMDNLSQYTIGFLDGVEKGKKNLLDNLGKSTVEMLKNFLDSQARLNPQTLHHVYEWYQTGSPNARLFDIDYIVSGNGLSFNYTFSQSKSISRGSNTPFYDKASIMENGISITIKPNKGKYLKFANDLGEDIFSQGPITINNPGGNDAKSGFENTINLFFDNYFAQTYLKSSGILEHLSNPIDYKKNIRRGVKGGKIIGEQVGYNWVSKDFGGIE